MHSKHSKKGSIILYAVLKIAMWVKDCNILYAELSLSATVSSSSHIL